MNFDPLGFSGASPAAIEKAKMQELENGAWLFDKRAPLPMAAACRALKGVALLHCSPQVGL